MTGLADLPLALLTCLAAPAPASSTAPVTVPAPAPEAAATAEPAPAPEPAPTAEPPPEPEYIQKKWDLGLWPGVSLNAKHGGKKVRNNYAFALGWTRSTQLDGIAAGFGATVVDEDAQGVAISLGANITRGTHRGVQATHGYNYARQLRGVQFGGINRAKTAHGVQFGLLNVSGNHRGAQFGLINYAQRADASFALLPITKEGGIRPEVTTSDTALLEVGLRLPARFTYAFFTAGLHPVGTDGRGHVGTNLERGKSWQFGGGFGGHIPAGDKFFIDLDMASYGVTSGLRAGANLGALGKLRAMVGWQAAPRVAVFGGPTLNVLVDDLDNPVDRPGYGWVAYSTHQPDVILVDDPTFERQDIRVRVWPGFVAGIRF